MKHFIVVLFTFTFIFPASSTWAALTKTEVSQLYVAVFGRAGEGDGNDYWRNDPSSTSMATTANVMLDTSSAQDYFGSTLYDNLSFIEHIYSNTLGKTYGEDSDGIDYWVSELDAGKTKGEVVAALIVAAQHPANAGLAQDRFNNKVEVSDYCADTIAAYTDLATFTGFIEGITYDATTVTAVKNSISSIAATTVPTVTSAGQVWMDRNLGASRVATSPTDSLAFGDLYQWGRGSDGHEKRTSGITHVTSSEDTPGHSNFIAAGDGNNWMVPQNDNLWQGVSGVNNPCPTGFRVPTKTEWETELSSWGSNDITGAFLSPLHLVLAGNRDDEDGSICDYGLPGEGSEIVGSCDSAFDGDYWSSTVSDSTSLNEVNHGSNAYILGFASSDTINFGSTSSTEVAGTYGVHRADGYSVRCIKD